MLEDGRIIYTRWDYVMKAYNVIQQLWAVNPDGRAATLAFGDHYAFSVGPIAFFEARQIPGTSRVICTGAAHHNSCVGPIMIVDLDQNRGNRNAMVNVTSEVGYPEINDKVLREVVYEELPGRGMSNTRSDAGWYSSPYPISESHFLVISSFENPHNARHGYGLYLMDVHHNRELIYRFKDASCYSPMPLRTRKRPRVIPDMVKGVEPNTPGTFIVTDIYQGLDGVKRGDVSYLRVLESEAKTTRTTPQRCDIGLNSGWDIRAVLGTVPVEADGSAHFIAPPGKLLFFEALDKDYLEIRRMRNYVNIMPGEVNSCVGCHEPYGTAPMPAAGRALLAMKRPPSKITPPPWGTEGFSFQRNVQPILNKHCIRCHTGEKESDKPYDLRGKRWVQAPVGYDRDHAPHRQHMVSDSFMNLLKYVSYVRVGSYQGPKLPLAPYATGSHESKLMHLLKKGHNEVKLDLSEWRTLAAWIDCNAPFYGSGAEIVLPHMLPPEPLRTQSAVDKERIVARVKELSSSGASVLSYVDCGVQVHSDAGDVAIKQLSGKGWTFRGAEVVGDLAGCHRDITFDAKEIVYRISGLRQGTQYSVHLSWWDFNGDQRRQSVWVSGTGGKGKLQLRKTSALPAYLARKELPETVTVALPANLTARGDVEIFIQNDGGANAVLGELWVTRTRNTREE